MPACVKQLSVPDDCPQRLQHCILIQLKAQPILLQIPQVLPLRMVVKQILHPTPLYRPPGNRYDPGPRAGRSSEQDTTLHDTVSDL